MNDGLSMVAVGSGPPLVVLPGLGQGADLSVRVPRVAAWSNSALATGLKRRIHLIHRPVAPPADMTVADLAGWHATALAERFGEPVDVMAVSGGGITALQLALDHPETVRRLALCVTASTVSEHGKRELRHIIEREGLGRSAARSGSRLIADGPLRLLTLVNFLTRRSHPRAPGEAALVYAVQDWDVTDRLPEITIPTLLIGGSRDTIFPPELVRRTASALPDARLLLLRGRSHTSALFDPRTKSAIAAFLDQRV
ncbi:alpha/beta fold hydrolase [Nocardia sp. NPDC004068]|uniref:alpha/beta fold hydrolase n=1 Tax=Nocardia sp. NPDC004068 TaxID=3364303 RepID=UPI003682FF5E